jgi:IS605 OrfB family transposase
MNSLKTLSESLHIIQQDITVKENTYRLNRNECFKIKIYPNTEQKKYLVQCLGNYRLTYNSAINIIKQKKSYNQIEIRKLVFKKIRKKNPNNTWYDLLPYDSKVFAVIEACNTFKSNFKKQKLNKTYKFDVKYKSKLFRQQNLKIDDRTIKYRNNMLYIFNSKLKENFKYKNRYTKKLNYIFKNYKICDSEIIREFDGSYYLCLNYKYDIFCKNKKPINMVSIDPGVKTLYTCYSDNGILIKLGNNIQHLYNKYNEKIKILENIKKKAKGRKKRNIKKRLHKYRRKIKNIVANAHSHLASLLAKNCDKIILPKLDIKNIINKVKRNINKNIARDILDKSLYKLHQKLTDQCKKHNTDVYDIKEHYTSVTCSNCYNVKNKGKLKGARVYECSVCNLKFDRDYNAAKNIMIKYYRENYDKITKLS